MQITVLSDKLTVIKELRYKLGIELSNCIKIYDKLVNNQFDDIIEEDKDRLLNYLKKSDSFIVEESEPFAVETECGLLLEIDYEADTVASEYWCICSDDCRGCYFISDINKKEKMISLEVARNLYPRNINKVISTLEVLRDTFFMFKDTEKTLLNMALDIVKDIRNSINNGCTSDVLFYYDKLSSYTTILYSTDKANILRSVLEFLRRK